MAAPVSMLSALSPNNDFNTLLVRVTRVWEAINKRTNQLMFTNLIFLDEEDNHMLATIRNNQKDIFLPLLSEGEVYSISNVKIVPGPALYKSVDRDLAINFYYKIKIQKVPHTDAIPRYKFELKEFEEIPKYVADVKCFIDIAGMVINHGQLETRTNGARKMDVILANARSEKLVVALWEDKATQFLELLAKESEVAGFVVITGLLAKKYSDRVLLSTSDDTKTYYNIDYPPLNDLRVAIAKGNGNRPENLPKPVATRFASVEESSPHNSSIKEILEASLPSGTTVICRTCEATVIAILEAEGWFYNCCPRCSRKVHVVKGGYNCNHCEKDTNDFKPRLIVRVEDGSTTTSLTLFNKEADELIGVPVDKLLAEFPEAGDVVSTPPIIKNIVGKKCAFDIKINAYNTERGYEEYTVYRLSECIAAGHNSDVKEMDGNATKKQKKA